MPETLPFSFLQPGVSVIVCGYNSAEVIVPTLEALSRQHVPEDVGYEVILVDNNCTDDTVALAKKAWQGSRQPLPIVVEVKPGLMNARRAGVREARYEIILFVDHDNVLISQWVSTLLRLFREMPRVGIIRGWNEAFIRGATPDWFNSWQTSYACGPGAEKSGKFPFVLFGAGLAFRSKILRTIFFQSPPLCLSPKYLAKNNRQEMLRGDDTEICQRCRMMGWETYYESSLKLHHVLLPQRLNWNYVLRARQGGGVARTILQMYQSVLAGENPQNYLHWLLFVLGEWKTFLFRHGIRIFHKKKPGSETSYQFSFLLGMSKGLWRQRQNYHSARQEILRFQNQVAAHPEWRP